MSRTPLLALAACLFAALLALILVATDTFSFGRIGADTEGVEEETASRAFELVEGGRVGATDAAGTDALGVEIDDASNGDERRALEAPATERPDAPLPIRGQIVDRYGVAVEGVFVEWLDPKPVDEVELGSVAPVLGDAPAVADASRDAGSKGSSPGGRVLDVDDNFVDVDDEFLEEIGVSMSGGEFAANPFDAFGPSYVAWTDGTGWFEIAESDARRGGQLRFGDGLFSPRLPRAQVHTDGSDHFLRFPARGPDAPRLLVELRDAHDGAPLVPELVELELVKVANVDGLLFENELPASLLVDGSFRTAVHPDDVFRRSGLLRVDRLAPGTWRLHVRAANSAFHTQDVTIPVDGDDVRIELALRTFDGTWFATRLDGEGVDALAPESALGFADFPGDVAKWRPLGERRPDRQFVHTLRFGGGPVSGAVLEIDLEAASGMAHNDAIALEFLGERRFAWSSRISGVASGGSWNSGTRETLFLDLALLPTGEGQPSMLELLEDGALDVYVQDDTAVHGLRLHVMP